MDILTTLAVAGQFFVEIAAELILLFIGITFLVGLLQAYIPEERIRRVLAGRRQGVGNIVAAGFGALTPFCSCSTIPILLGLLEVGIPFGVCMSFLFASPLLNPVILALLLALVGVVPTVIYCAVTFTSAVIIGLLLERFGYGSYVKDVMVEGRQEPCDCAGSHGVRIRRAFSFAVNLFRQVFPYLILGAGIGAFIYGFIPGDLIVAVAGPENPFAIPVAAVIGIPMYIRAETLIPVSAVLLEKGMGIGAVMALIIGGAGASIPEVTLIAAIFERRLVAVFVATILTVAIFAGVLFQLLSMI